MRLMTGNLHDVQVFGGETTSRRAFHAELEEITSRGRAKRFRATLTITRDDAQAIAAMFDEGE